MEQGEAGPRPWQVLEQAADDDDDDDDINHELTGGDLTGKTSLQQAVWSDKNKKNQALKSKDSKYYWLR